MKVERISAINFDELYKIMASSKITESQKTDFVRKNKSQIEKIINYEISTHDFKTIMDKRPLKKFRPLRNSFTKKGDKLILAKALGIQPSNVDSYIKNVSTSINSIDNINCLSPEKIDMLKTYVYRHGSKDDLVNFLDYELKKSKNLVTTLYKTLTYYSGGVADYFIRPIHRMDNKTLIRVYNIIDKNIKESESMGLISEAESNKIAKWALIRIYKIQNNSKLINAIKTYKELS